MGVRCKILVNPLGFPDILQCTPIKPIGSAHARKKKYFVRKRAEGQSKGLWVEGLWIFMTIIVWMSSISDAIPLKSLFKSDVLERIFS